jgi:hypothetical protein
MILQVAARLTAPRPITKSGIKEIESRRRFRALEVE